MKRVNKDTPTIDGFIAEIAPKTPHLEKLRRWAGTIGRISLIGVSSSLLLSLDVTPDNFRVYYPDQTIECDTGTTAPSADGLRIVDANIFHNPHFAKTLVRQAKPQIATFQEVRGQDAKNIVDQQPCTSAIFGMGDFAVDPTNGGLGNLILSSGPKANYGYRQFYGNVDLADLATGIFTLSKEKIKASYKESRSMVIGSFVVAVDGKKVTLNIANAHTASKKAGENQLKRIEHYANKDGNMTQPNEINIIIGDFNRSPQEVKKVFNNPKNQWAVANIGPTSRNSNQQIDQVLVQPTLKIGDKSYSVTTNPKILETLGSDHRAFVVDLSIKPDIN